MKKEIQAESPLLKILTQEDVNAMRRYTKFCGELYRKLTKSVGRYPPGPGLHEVCVQLKRLFGLELHQTHENVKALGEAARYYQSMSTTFCSDDYLPLAKEILANPHYLVPYISYRCLGHKSHSNLRPLKFVRWLLSTRDVPLLAQFILATFPLLKPSLLYKLTLKYASTPEVVAEFWKLYLSQTNSICAKPEGKNAIRALYELRHAAAVRKIESSQEKQLRERLRYEAPDGGFAVYSLLDVRYGYVLAHACRVLPVGNAQAIIDKYSLPGNLLYMELSPPCGGAQRLVRPDLKSPDWLWLLCNQEEYRKSHEGHMRTRVFAKRSKWSWTIYKRELPAPTYLQETQYRVTCPLLELLRRDADIPQAKVDDQILSLQESQRKYYPIHTEDRLATHEFTYYLSKHGKMSTRIFESLWSARADTDFVHGLRPTEQVPVYHFLAEQQDMRTLVQVMLYGMNQGKHYPSRVMSVWLAVACQRLDINVRSCAR